VHLFNHGLLPTPLGPSNSAANITVAISASTNTNHIIAADQAQASTAEYTVSSAPDEFVLDVSTVRDAGDLHGAQVWLEPPDAFRGVFCRCRWATSGGFSARSQKRRRGS
jgi:hypothetical protein